MFNFFKKKHTNNEVIAFIEKTLFPPIEFKKVEGEDIYIDRSVDVNLTAVLVDLKDGLNDENTIQTLKYCISLLTEVREKYKLFSSPTKKGWLIASTNRD